MEKKETPARTFQLAKNEREVSENVRDNLKYFI